MAPVRGQQRKNSFLLVSLVLSAVLLDALTTPERVSPALGERGVSWLQPHPMPQSQGNRLLRGRTAALEVVKNEPGYGNSRL